MLKRALGFCLATLLIVPACTSDKAKDVDVEAEIARNLGEADANLRNDKVAEAEAGYKVVLGYDATNAAALTGLGRVELAREQPAAAIEPLEKAIAAAPNDAKAHATLGQAYVATNDWAKAADHLGKAWELDKDTEQYALEYGAALREAKQLDAAITVLQEVAAINPQIKYVYRELGKAQLDASDHDKALESFMKAQLAWPGDQDSFAGAGMVYEAQGKIGDSIDQWAQYIQQDCCSTYSKEIAQPKIAELKAKENAAPN